MCVDATALYAAVEAMSDGSRAVLAYSHAGTPLASIDIGRPDLPPSATQTAACMSASKLSIDPEGRVCVALEEAHEVRACGCRVNRMDLYIETLQKTGGI